MSDNSHDRFAELAAAFALDALDTDEESFFRSHLAICAECQTMVADFSRVTADLAGGLSGEEPDPDLRERILDAAMATPGTRLRAVADDAGTATAMSQGFHATASTPLAKRRRQRVRLLAAAAVVVLAGVGGGLLATAGGIGQPPASCSASTSCTQVRLTSARTDGGVATVIVSHGSVWIQPGTIPVDDATTQIYILWEIVGHRAPRPIGGFDVVHGARGAIAVGSVNGGRVTAYAVSLEHGRSIPRAPSNTVATGRVL